ncbi:hypothetical protein U1Q18_000078 [Sarracenia purpurea var. burkii]
MQTRFIGLMLLLLFLAYQEIAVYTEAVVCHKVSRRFKGRCNNRRNCHTVCKQEGFLGGQCTRSRLSPKCVCNAKCPKRPPRGGGGPKPPKGDNPPEGDNPPGDDPGGDNPPPDQK